MYIYILEQKDKYKIGKTTNPKQRLTKLQKEWGDFFALSSFFKFSIDKLKENNLTIDNIEKTIHRLLKLKGLYINDLDKKDGYKEFFKKSDHVDIFQLFYDNFDYYIEEEYSLDEIEYIHNKENIEIEICDESSCNQNFSLNIHNHLISGRHNWTTNEIKIVLKLITKMSETQDLYQLNFNEISNLLGDSNLSSSYLKEISNNLMNKNFEIIENENEWTIFHWFREIKYKNGTMSILIENKILPYLLNLKKNFTKFNIQNILPMKSNYSMRIYQLLKQYQTIGYRKFNIDNLRDILKVPKSYTINNFRNKVILKAKEEMNKYSDITFDFEEIKTGRKITDIKFTIKKKENHSDIRDEMKEENPWYYSKYYGKNVIQSEIEYENIIDIKESDKYLTIKFEDLSEIRVKNENSLINIIK